MNIRALISVLFYFIFSPHHLWSQWRSLSLPDAISVAQNESLDFKSAVNSATSSYWDYYSIKASFLPKLSLAGTIPSYNRNINKVTLPNGDDKFIPQNQAYSSLELDLTQNVPFTGGVFSVSSSLSRIDIFGTDNLNSRQYSSIPFHISYWQNSFLYNSFRWDKLIAPLRLEESKRDFSEKLEQIASTTVQKYFELLQMQAQIGLDRQNPSNADTLLKTTEIRFSIGTRDRNDVLQARINQLEAKNNLSKDLISSETLRRSFLQYLRLPPDDSLILAVPDIPEHFVIDPVIAMEKASSNRKEVISFRLRRLESRQKMASLKSQVAPSLGLSVNAGVSQADPELSKVYQHFQQQQAISIQLQVPLLDWGVNRSRIKQAAAEMALKEIQVDQDQIAFEQEILLQTLEWNALYDQLITVKEKEMIANERYKASKERYLAGTISFMEFSNAQQQKDAAVNDKLNNLFIYWKSFYVIRRLTMYDFRLNPRIFNKVPGKK